MLAQQSRNAILAKIARLGEVGLVGPAGRFGAQTARTATLRLARFAVDVVGRMRSLLALGMLYGHGRRARGRAVRAVGTQLGVFSLHAVLARRLVVALDLALAAWPTRRSIADFSVRVDDAAGLLRGQMLDTASVLGVWHVQGSTLQPNLARDMDNGREGDL